jgi:hypothetical protein
MVKKYAFTNFNVVLLTWAYYIQDHSLRESIFYLGENLIIKKQTHGGNSVFEIFFSLQGQK